MAREEGEGGSNPFPSQFRTPPALSSVSKGGKSTTRPFDTAFGLLRTYGVLIPATLNSL